MIFVKILSMMKLVRGQKFYNMSKFYSKILLFGEYSIIKGSQGLAFPLKKFYGELKFPHVNTSKPEHNLSDFCQYISGRGILANLLDTDLFRSELEQGLYFDSNIPIGHGVGSSGALCASIFARYSKEFKRKKTYTQSELKYLQDLMALMESYYHGTSSGLDCLISLIDKPVFIRSRNDVESIEDLPKHKMGHFYLYETHIIRKTAPLVHTFLKDYDQSQQVREGVQRFSQLTNELILSLLQAKKTIFDELFSQISRFQYLNFETMICDNIKAFWLQGLESKEFFVKLCGAGGGGYYLVYSPNKALSYPNLTKIDL